MEMIWMNVSMEFLKLLQAVSWYIIRVPVVLHSTTRRFSIYHDTFYHHSKRNPIHFINIFSSILSTLHPQQALHYRSITTTSKENINQPISTSITRPSKLTHPSRSRTSPVLTPATHTVAAQPPHPPRLFSILPQRMLPSAHM